MRSHFERHLTALNEEIKEAIPAEDKSVHLEALDARVNEAAHYYNTSVEREQEILGLQVAKQEEMLRLRKQLRDLDSGEFVPTEGAAIMVEGDTLFTPYEGRRLRLSRGDLANAPRWGNEFAVHQDLPRGAVKEYLIAQAKANIQALLDEQIVARYTSTTASGAGHAEALRRAFEGRHEDPTLGQLMEKMVVSLLNRLSIDHNLGFSIEEADLADDFSDKIDFYINRADHTRAGVIEESKEGRTGIQFTIHSREDVLQHKIAQLDKVRPGLQKHGRVRDVVLVNVPQDISAEMKFALEEMYETEAPISPDRLLETDVQEDIFRGVLGRLYDNDELDAMWEKIAHEEMLVARFEQAA
jgi:hypothetical protein